MTEKKCETCNKEFETADALLMHNRAKHPEKIPKERKPLPIKKIRNWTIFLVITGLIIWGVVGLINNGIKNKTVLDESQLNFEAPNNQIHWHPSLSIVIDGKKEIFPANIGLSGAHMPIHTHEDANAGILHMENNRPTKRTVTLGYFFEVWGRKLSKDCIFDYCTDKGTLKMYVNEKENNEFQNYFMQDEDKILIEYTTNSN